MELVPSRSLAEIVRDGRPAAAARGSPRSGCAVLDALVAAHRGRRAAPRRQAGQRADHGRRAGSCSPTSASPGTSATRRSRRPALLVGSPDYIAPERARGPAGPGSRPTCGRWARRCTTAVEGRPPFERNGPLPTLAAVVMDEPDPPRLAGPLRPVIDGLLVKDPAHRLDADGTRAMLERVLRRQPAGVTVPLPRRPADEARPLPPAAADSGPPADTQATVYGPEPPTEDPTAPPRPGRRRRTALLAGLLVLVLAGVTAVLVPVLSSGGQEEATGPTTPSARPTTAAPSSQPTTANPTTASRTTAAPTRSTASSPTSSTGSRVTPPPGFTRYTDPRDRLLRRRPVRLAPGPTGHQGRLRRPGLEPLPADRHVRPAAARPVPELGRLRAPVPPGQGGLPAHRHPPGPGLPAGRRAGPRPTGSSPSAAPMCWIATSGSATPARTRSTGRRRRTAGTPRTPGRSCAWPSRASFRRRPASTARRCQDRRRQV